MAAPPTEERPESVGIVGGGPAGMACAHDLRRLGYQVTVYEATDRLGGAMWLGIPEYRLDRQVLAQTSRPSWTSGWRSATRPGSGPT
ncbi:MAG: FAD-dependent oxidoreductase [Acidimicrobiales bacterium]